MPDDVVRPWDEPTEEYQPTLSIESWAGDARPMCRVGPRLRIDAAPVTHAAYERFVHATSHPPPSTWQTTTAPTTLRERPVTSVSVEDARAYARWANKRLPLHSEWTAGLRAMGFELAGGGAVWEWTASRHREGHVVCGGPDRGTPQVPGRFGHRSWEDEPAGDVGFRCVVDLTLATAPPVVVDCSHAVRLAGGHVEAVVDVSDHDFFITGAGLRPFRLAASRRGLAEAIQRIHEGIGHVRQRATIEPPLMAALLFAARRRAPSIDAAWDAVVRFESTPLMLCRGVVANSFLVNDVVRFAPAAIAVSRIEDDRTDATAPERTEVWAEQLSRWRELYCAPDSTQRSVNRTLTMFGEEASAGALWGLRRVTITAPLPSVQHVEVLGCLGGRNDRLDPRLHEAILRATSAELGTALVMIDEGDFDEVVFGDDSPAQRLAEILSVPSIDELRDALDRRVRFADLLTHAIHRLQNVLQLDTQTIEPPIPLPTIPGVRFLGTVGAILREGIAMDHCVATRAPRAMEGLSYLFHVEHDALHATVEVGHDGQIIEARGPSNVDNAAVFHARFVLGLWAMPLRWPVLASATQIIWSSSSPTLPPGTEPVTTLGALAQILAALPTPSAHDNDLVKLWCWQKALQALEGRCWLVVHRVDGVALDVSSLNADGTLESSSSASGHYRGARP